MENNNNTEEPTTALYVATLQVDIECLRKTRAEDIGDEADSEGLDEAVMKELGWVASSGINPYLLEKVELREGTPVLVDIKVMYDGLEFSEKRVTVVPSTTPPVESDLMLWADQNIAKCYDEDEEPTEETNGYEYPCGRLVSISSVKPISEVEYHILKNYL